MAVTGSRGAVVSLRLLLAQVVGLIPYASLTPLGRLTAGTGVISPAHGAASLATLALSITLPSRIRARAKVRLMGWRAILTEGKSGEKEYMEMW